MNNVDQLSFNWYYTWRGAPLWDNDSTPENAMFVPMIWDETHMAALKSLPIGAGPLLGFNEPDHPDQANMTVEQALALWPELIATGKRLGSPAPTTTGALGENSWLGRFMSQAEAKNYKVDFITIHYYSDTKDVGAFQTYLEAVYKQYGKPIWVTEWALADWNNPGRFTAQEQADFAKAATLMLDDLPFVERHSWFASYAGGDGWYLNNEVWGRDGMLTPVGQMFAELTSPDAPSASEPPQTGSAGALTGTSGSDVLTGTAGNDTINGLDGNDWIHGRAGDDAISGGSGQDTLIGAEGRDVLTGGLGKDAFLFGSPLGDANVDRITDFNVADDTIHMDNIVFTALKDGRLAKGVLWMGSVAHDADDRVIYDRATGNLWYDTDGTGMAVAVKFAILSPGLKLTASDFLVV
nr:glycosyl hydrolase [Microvirga zambiensis]